MKQAFFGLSLGFLGLILATHHAFAETPRNCGLRADIVAQLGARYGETRRSLGLAANNAVVEVYASAESGSWTILATLPNGLSCMLASGQAFETVDEALPAAGIDG